MPADDTEKPAARMTLQGSLDDMGLLRPWIDGLVTHYAIPSDTAFAIHLCLEEAVSNVIRHGYDCDPSHAVTVDYAIRETDLIEFTIEDHARPFDPLAPEHVEEMAQPSAEDILRPGGRGIRLLRSFAGTLAYERLAGGNRLTIGFVLPHN